MSRIVVFFALIIFANTFLVAQQLKNYSVKFLTTQEGLSQNAVTSIIEDKHGFMWFGTRGGLNRYDGYTFKHFKPLENKDNSITNPSIEVTYIDRNNNIWIGAKADGVCYYNIESEKITRLPDSLGLSDKRVISIHEDLKGNLWFGTRLNGVFRFNPKTQKIKHFLGTRRVTQILEDKQGVLWFSSGLLSYLNEEGKIINLDETGLFGKFNDLEPDPVENCFWLGGWKIGLMKFDCSQRKIVFNSQDIISNTENVPLHSFCFSASNEHVLVGTWSDGLYQFNKKKKTFRKIPLRNEGENTSINNAIILDLFKDKRGDIWAGLEEGGVVLIQNRQPFHLIEIPGLSHPHINKVLKDRKGRLWIGTKGHGLYVKEKGKTTYVTGAEDSVYKYGSMVVKSLYETKEGDIYIGFNTGLAKVVPDKKNGRYELDMLDLPVMKVTCILEHRNGFLMGTQERGFFWYNRKKEKLRKVTMRNAVSGRKKVLLNEYVTKLWKDQKGRIWVATHVGLFLYRHKDKSCFTVENLTIGNKKLTCDIILDFMEDHSGNFWIATPCGMHRLVEQQEKKFKLETYTIKDGLPDDYIQGILEDKENKIWISTNFGLSQFNINTKVFRNFDKTDGIACSGFESASCFKSPNGELFFGGMGGLVSFFPSEISEDPNIPEIVITSLNVHGETVEVGKEYEGNIILDRSINETEELVLNYTKNEFSIEFSALDFSAPSRNQYAYKLDGRDKKWQYLGSRHLVPFSNLKPGTYTLHLRGSNNNSKWNEVGRKIRIKILSPPWKTWWALLLYIAVALVVVSTIRRNAVKQEQLSQKLELERINGEQERQISEMKLRFFTNISHEFRTPLTLILAPIQELLTKNEKYALSEEVSHKITIINNNAQRLLSLINQLIDFRKTESGAMKLKASPGNISQFVYEIGVPFKEMAEINQINFTISAKEETPLWFDHDKLEMVLNNLLSNAFKYVAKNGIVKLVLKENDSFVFVEVEDNGRGIPAKDIDKIFERFYQVEDHRRFSSSGIGLALTKRLVEMHHGEISVNSTVGKKTVFTIKLPKGNTHLTEEQKDTKETTNEHIPTFSATGRTLTVEAKPLAKKAKHQQSILVVEDNGEIRNYIENLLSNYYDVAVVEDGLAGWEYAQQKLPDLIVSDVMMPNMDGFELCEKIKSTERTNHIPIVLLTAKTADQFRLFGVKAGADSYISKPFNPDYLIEKIGQILSQRKTWQTKFSKKIKLGPKEIEITPQDEKIIKKAIQIIEKHIDDPEFDANSFASEMNMSLSTLNRRLKTISEQSPAKFIRSIRLKRAAQLLADPEKTISEVAIETGFGQVRNFRSSFQSEFGSTPSEYRKQHYKE